MVRYLARDRMLVAVVLVRVAPYLMPRRHNRRQKRRMTLTAPGEWPDEDEESGDELNDARHGGSSIANLTLSVTPPRDNEDFFVLVENGWK